MTRLTLPQPLASALVHRLATLIVVDKPPTWACPNCKGRLWTWPGRGFSGQAKPCFDCDSSLGERGDLIEVWSNDEPPTYHQPVAGWVVLPRDPECSDPWLARVDPMERGGTRPSIPLPLGERVGVVRITDALPIVEFMADPCCDHIVSNGKTLNAWRFMSDDPRCWQAYFEKDRASNGGSNWSDLSDELAWQSFSPGRWALLTEPEDA